MGKIAYLLLFLMGSSAQAFEVLELDKIDLTYRYYTTGGRIPLISQLPNKEPANYVGLGLNMNILETVRWDSIIHSYTDRDTSIGGGQFRTVSWEFSLYFSLFRWLDAGYYHHSQHVLDTSNKLGFPVEDALFLRLNVYKSSNKREAIF